jgi:hypothetical protein
VPIVVSLLSPRVSVSPTLSVAGPDGVALALAYAGFAGQFPRSSASVWSQA